MDKAIIEKISVGMPETNCYIFGCLCTQEAVIIDPGFESDKIKIRIAALKLKIKCIINTHGHIDHISADNEFNLPVFIHKNDGPFLKSPQMNLSQFFGRTVVVNNPVTLLNDNEIITVGTLSLKVLHTPGHTPGGICLLSEGIVFTGDTLFFQGIGRTDFPYGDEKAILTSIREKLLTLSGDTIIYPGHGPASSIEAESKNNSYV
ncbi:MAG: MBL fold metallo-hydrolase [Candidatus Omnitrophota bacterium]